LSTTTSGGRRTSWRLAALLVTDREAFVNGKAWLVRELFAAVRGT
jgi:hypothetical protein